jgi:hypothetical protein
LGEIRGKSKKFPDSKGDARGNARHFLDSSDYAQGGEAAFRGIWRIKKRLLPIFADKKERVKIYILIFFL